MIRVAIPTFQDRVSPVIDSCAHLLIIEIDQSDEVERKNVYWGDMSLAERCKILQKIDVHIVICGGISETFANMLRSLDVRLINGIAGDIEAVLSAYKGDQLNSPAFYMPGFKAQTNTMKTDK